MRRKEAVRTGGMHLVSPNIRSASNIFLQRFKKTIRFLPIPAVAFLFFGCSSVELKHVKHGWERTKAATRTAASDPVTWAPVLGATFLYTTGYDDKITRHFMENPIMNNESDEAMRYLVGGVTFTTAALVPDEKRRTKVERIAVEVAAFQFSRWTVNALNANIYKESPNGNRHNAIGSHHAVEPFAGAAMTKRNVAEMDLPGWADCTVVGSTYLMAAGSAFIRVQEGGHSFADQLVNASIGHFVGLFFYDVFMAKNADLGISVSKESMYFNVGFPLALD
jgi:hypothetical protein